MAIDPGRACFVTGVVPRQRQTIDP
jgi:hypothetical protein